MQKAGTSVLWRRLSGAAVMGVGALVLAALAALIAVLLISYVEWENAVDALGTIAMVVAAPMLGACILLGLGRWLYGDWGRDAPIRNAVSQVLRFVGFSIVGVFGVLLALLMLAGVPPQDRTHAVILGGCVIAGFVLVLAGTWVGRLKKRQRLIGD